MYRICVLLMATMAFLCGHQTRAAVTLSQQSLRPQPGNKVSCKCTMSEGERFVEWRKPDGSTVPVSSSGTVRVQTDGNVHTLKFTDVKVAEGGNYKCRGSLNNEATFKLEVAFDVSTTDLTQQITNGETGRIVLNAPGYPKPDYNWRKGNTELSPTTDARYSLLDGGSLRISMVKISDQGNYTIDILQSSYEVEVKIEVYVVELPKINPFPPSRVYLTEGYPASFVCKATGRPPPKYQWLGPNEQAISSLVTFHIKDGNLTVIKAERGLIGKYTCRAYNEIEKTGKKVGEATAQVEIKDVYVPPKIISSNNDVLRKRGDDFDLECEAEGVPSPTVEWKKNGERDPRQKISSNRSVIEFRNIQVKDGGRYSCEARNSAADSNGNAIVATIVRNVNIKSKPYVIEQAPDKVYSFIGNSDPTFVTCTFGGYPEPWVVMKYDKKLVSNATTTANFSIITDAKDNFGTYHCRAQNEYGHQNQTIELKEVEKPSEVRNFKADRSTCDSVTLTWASPLKDGGMPINKFVLEYDDNTRNIESWKRSHTILYLKRDEDYTFAIRATNKGAWGDKTNTKVKTKKYCVPGRPIIYEPSSSALDETSFTLKWRRPENTGGDDEIEYIIRYRDVSEDKEMPWKKFTTKETEYDIEDLDRQKRYKFEVTAKNKGGESSPDERYFVISKVGARSFQLQLVANFMVIFTAGILHLL